MRQEIAADRSGRLCASRRARRLPKENIASARAMEKGGMVRYGTEENGDPLFRFAAKEKAER